MGPSSLHLTSMLSQAATGFVGMCMHSLSRHGNLGPVKSSSLCG